MKVRDDHKMKFLVTRHTRLRVNRVATRYHSSLRAEQTSRTHQHPVIQPLSSGNSSVTQRGQVKSIPPSG